MSSKLAHASVGHVQRTHSCIHGLGIQCLAHMPIVQVSSELAHTFMARGCMLRPSFREVERQ